MAAREENSRETSADDQFTIPTHPTAAFHYDVDCDNDAINEASGVTGDYTCDYGGNPDTYTIRIQDNTVSGTGFPRIYFNNGGDKDKLLTVAQWGAGQWTSMYRAFEGCNNLAITDGGKDCTAYETIFLPLDLK
jgi:hypothetical protein